MNRRISTKHWLTLTKVTSSFDTYGDNVSFKRRRDDEDKDEEPPLIKQGSKVKRAGKDQSQPLHQGKRPPRQLASLMKRQNYHKMSAGRVCSRKGQPTDLVRLGTTTRSDINPLDLRKPLPLIPNFSRESAQIDVYSKRRIIAGIRMKYLPQTIWRQSDRDKAGAMIQAIDKQLKTRRIMRSLEKFVGGRPYEGDFRLLQRTI
ncbi:hypothetical protein Tco_0038531 [Tanacetum coccineum]